MIPVFFSRNAGRDRLCLAQVVSSGFIVGNELQAIQKQANGDLPCGRHLPILEGV